MSDMNRYWNREICHGLPIAYLIKGYSLTISTARRLLERVLDACYEKKAHVPCVTFDGQFAHLKDTNDNGDPLTLFEMQRKLWSEVKHKSKNDLLAILLEMFGQCNYYYVSDCLLSVDNILETAASNRIVVEYKNQEYGPLSTPISLFKQKSATDKAEKSSSNESMIQCQFENLGEETVEALTEMINDNTDNDSFVEREFEIGEASSQPQGTEQKTDETSTALEIDHSVETDQQMNGGDISTNGRIFLLTTEDFRVMFNLLLDGKRKSKWEKHDEDFIKKIFSSATEINKETTAYELRDIIKYLNIRFKSASYEIPNIPQSLPKAEKINELCSILGLCDKLPTTQRKSRPRKIQSLQDMCKSVIKSKKYPKHVLAVAYCQSVWPVYNKQFYENSTVTEVISLSSIDGQQHIKFKPLYKPMYSEPRKQLEVRVMDGTHIRTNIKAKLIRNGLERIKISAWIKVAESNKTNLSLALLSVQDDGKIMHQQSDAYVRTMFDEDVELQMIENGDTEEARFCRVFRHWHEAEDNPGLSAFERCKRSLMLREWLLENYSFYRFPPPTMYVRGIPRVTYEGLVCSIDAHILLYALTKGGSYNWRSVSTLVAENFMGELAEYAQTNNGVPNGTSLRNDMAKISHLHGMRFNPNRKFQMQTSKARAYEMQTASVTREYNNNTGIIEQMCISDIVPRNHLFDEIAASSKKKGKISSLHEKPKGVQPVRFHYKVDESRILPSLTMGLTEDDLI